MVPGPLMLDLDSYALSDEEQQLVRHPAVGGVILFARNIRCRSQVADLAASLRELRPQLLLAVDQEGGRVQRLREGYTRLPSMAALGARYRIDDRDGSLLRDAGWLMAAEVLASGIDFSFAPVLDVDAHHCSVIADRAFADDPEKVAQAAALFVEGMHEAGMAATGKHFPGHGGVIADSHLETPVDNRGLAELEARDLVPFRRLATQLDAVMPAHIVFPRVDDQCVGFSRRWLQGELREKLGFGGAIFSDDLSMAGAEQAGGYAQRARLALEAGCDMVLVCNNRRGALEVLEALEETGFEPSGRLQGMAARRSWTWDGLREEARYGETVSRLGELTN